jgi:hypothetical protein
MAKIEYISKNFKSASLDLISQANDIIKEYQAQGFSLTLRQLYYQFVSRDLIPNRQSEYKRLGSIISDSRLAGLIDWEAIEDRTRELKELTHWTDPGSIVRAAARGFRVDHWEGQAIRPEVWIEKEALVGVIKDVCERLDVAYFACKGYVSQSEMWKASQRYKEREDCGQGTVIIHLGDHDPSGVDMTRDIDDRQNIFWATGCAVERIALTMDQVNQYDPPPNPAKLTDSRAGTYVKDYGYDSWELDALEPRVLSDLIADKVLEYRDESILEEVLEKERKYKAVLARVEQNWETL